MIRSTSALAGSRASASYSSRASLADFASSRLGLALDSARVGRRSIAELIRAARSNVRRGDAVNGAYKTISATMVATAAMNTAACTTCSQVFVMAAT
jgi:hypothetical protein